MYRCDYCDGIVAAKCISIQFQRYRHTNHSEPVTIVKTIHFTPERSSLPVIVVVDGMVPHSSDIQAIIMVVDGMVPHSSDVRAIMMVVDGTSTTVIMA